MPLLRVPNHKTYRKIVSSPKQSNGAQKLTLEGKRVLIMVGTSGLGLAVAEAAKAEGSDVVVASSKQSRVDAAWQGR
jgi:NADPH:quinone reductase-like Zn-dependent oxidoreductase